MENLTYNNNQIRRVPINRNNLFFSEESYQFDIDLGKNYIEQDTNQTVILYEVDLEKTNLSSVYKESLSNGIVFKTPVELHVLYEIETPTLESYDTSKNLGTYVKNGKLTFGLYQQTLDELGVKIKNGDYIGVQVSQTHMEYYTVVNDGRINYDNEHSIYGYLNPFRSIVCASIDPSEFNGK